MNAGTSSEVWTWRVVVLKRSSKPTKGGRRFSFGALVAIGNLRGCVGLGSGKSKEVASALRKAERAAAAQKVQLLLDAGRISHQIRGQYCGAEVLLRPAPPGTGIIASKAVRDVLECAGVKDVISKSMGARNPANVAKATLRALLSLRLEVRKPKVPVVKLTSGEAAQGNPFQLN